MLPLILPVTGIHPLSKTNVKTWFYWVIFPFHRLFLGFYFRAILIEGIEHLPLEGPMILAPKHFSRWDPLLVGLLSVEPLRFMTNANQFEGVQGWMIERLGAFPVDLAKPGISSLRCTIDLLKEGRKVVMFPEGGIVRNQVLRSLKPGLARLVLQAESLAKFSESVPVVPIALRYEPGAFFRAKVYIQIQPPLYSRQFEGERDRERADRFTEALERSLREGLTHIGAEKSLQPDDE